MGKIFKRKIFKNILNKEEDFDDEEWSQTDVANLLLNEILPNYEGGDNAIKSVEDGTDVQADNIGVYITMEDGSEFFLRVESQEDY